jgi:hypothetical protein
MSEVNEVPEVAPEAETTTKTRKAKVTESAAPEGSVLLGSGSLYVPS